MRRLLRLVGVPPAERRYRLAWSHWRRAHQAGARRAHGARRAKAYPLPPPTPLAPPALPRAALPAAPLTDAQWARVAPLLPPLRPWGGTPARDRRQVVAGLLWLARTGAAWRELPAAYGAWLSVYRYYHRWTASGHWPRILQVLQEDEPDA